MKRIDGAIQWIVCQSRWILAPFYVGLVAALVLLAFKFLRELLSFVPKVTTSSSADAVLAILELVDLILVGNLVLMVIFVGYENLVSKIARDDRSDRPSWMDKVDASGLKIHLFVLIVAISAIKLLRTFMHVGELTDRDLAWQTGILAVFVVSALLLGLSEKRTTKSE